MNEYVFTALQRMYAGFESQRASIHSARICDVRYEDLVADPAGTPHLTSRRDGPMPAQASHLTTGSGRKTGWVSPGKSGGTGKSVGRLASHCSARTRIV
jgi:hypothetical protein